MIKAYTTTIQGSLEGSLEGEHRFSRGIEEFPPIQGNPSGFSDDSSGFEFGRMDIGLCRSVIIMRYVHPKEDNMLPIPEKEHVLTYWISGKREKDCDRAKLRLEKMFIIRLNEESFDALERRNLESLN